jgi:L-histidine Nalpha-methyltransferase
MANFDSFSAESDGMEGDSQENRLAGFSVAEPSSSPEWEQRSQVENLSQLRLTEAETEGHDVMVGLSQQPKTLPAHYFYDDAGSDLFEQICQLPEYYLTRTEASILQRFGGAIAQTTGICELVELGSGSSTKTRLLLDAYQSLDYPLCYRPVDVSSGILASSAQQLVHDYPTLKVHALVGTYEQALSQLSAAYLPHRMIVFLGSSLGNLSVAECDRFFEQIAAALNPGDYFLLGVDLHKPTAPLEAAYNDRQGVTAAFNLNLLRHLNRRFDGNFDLTQFEHWAFYNQQERQIEMHLRSLKDQQVELGALQFRLNLQAGETIRSEISRKFELPQLQAQLAAHGLHLRDRWLDDQQWFALMLCQR